jgi:zinc protease
MILIPAILAAWAAAAAPEAPAPAVRPDMARPPAVEPMKPYRLPARSRWVLSNGLEAILVEDRRYPMVTARLAFRGGSSAVRAADAGLADAMAELLTDGTRKRTSKEIADAAEDYGGALEAGATSDEILLETFALSEHADKMLGLLAEVAREPSFPGSEVDLRRKNMQEELNQSRGEPDFLAAVGFYKKLYGGHPYAITAPTDASIAKITRDAVVSLHRRLVTPRNAVLVLVGDLPLEKAKKLVEEKFGRWSGAYGPADPPAFAAHPHPRTAYFLERPGAVQASIVIGNIACREDHPDYFGLLVANQVLGGSFSSRLVQDIRETKGYTYRIGSRLEQRMTSSAFRVRTPVRTEVAEPALQAIFGHLDRIRAEKPSDEELEKAKTFLAGSFARSLETQDGMADLVLHTRLHRLPEDFFDTYVERLEAVTGADVLRAAQTFIRPHEAVLMVVGSGDALKASLAKFSSRPVVPVDRDGN